MRASVFCFSKERAQTRAQAARSFLEGLKPASPRTALVKDGDEKQTFENITMLCRKSYPESLVKKGCEL